MAFLQSLATTAREVQGQAGEKLAARSTTAGLLEPLR